MILAHLTAAETAEAENDQEIPPKIMLNVQPELVAWNFAKGEPDSRLLDRIASRK